MVDASLKNTASMSVGSHFNAVSCDSIVDKLVILRRELVQALLDDVIAVQILDQDNNGEAKSNDDGVDLDVAFRVSLPRHVSEIREYPTKVVRTCLRVERKSIIFWTARVPCMLREILTRSCATDSQITFR